MSTLIYWFRNDLRLADNPAFSNACRQATKLVAVYCHAPAQSTAWDFERSGAHRQHFLAATLADLNTQLLAYGSGLLELNGAAQDLLPDLARELGANTIYCEDIAAPEEEAAVDALRQAGLSVETLWQSSLLNLEDLPFAPTAVADVFTTFRQALERSGVLPPAPLSAPRQIPPQPDMAQLKPALRPPLAPLEGDTRSSFPYFSSAYAGGATAANAHLQQYFARKLAHTYKDTRNGLTGTDYSSKFSPWLALGALSPRTAYAELKKFEAQHGANDSTYWLWFELLWREYFRLLHLKHGVRLYRAQGLTQLPPPPHSRLAFQRWCQGRTGEPLVDAGMRELAATGYLSNRLRQVVASYLIHDIACDWRAGAAWFESQLLDYDVYSNQGNWLYLAGRGTDPRTGRRFNPQKQTQDHDRNGTYRALWGVQ